MKQLGNGQSMINNPTSEVAVLLIEIVTGWLCLSALGLLGAVGACRSGHAEDVARGFTD